MDRIREITEFFNYSQTREQVLEKYVYLLKSKEFLHKKLQDVCRTRWVSRILGLEIFLEFYEALVKTFEEIYHNEERKFNRDSVKKAFCFLSLITTLDFIVTMVVFYHIMAITLSATILLQSETIDILQGMNLITALKCLCSNMQHNIDDYHGKWYKEAILIAGKPNVLEKAQRLCSKQTNRANQPSSTPSEYYKRSFTIPVIEHLENDLNARYSEKNLKIFDGLYIMPDGILQCKKKLGDIDWKATFKKFCEFYQDDFPNYQILDSEIDLWESYWKCYNGDIPDEIRTTIKTVSFPGFQNIQMALKILATMPVTSCSSERSFSAMCRLKNYTRSTMINDRLNGLALLHIHRDIIPSIDDVLDRYGNSGNRRLKFV